MQGKILYEREEQLLLSLKAGNEEALKLIYNEYWQPLFVSAYNVLKNKEACEDIIQEIFISLWRRKETLEITSLRAYLFTATRYQVFHAIRQMPLRADFAATFDEQFQNTAPDIPLYVKDLQRRINSSVDSLPEKCRNIYRLSREHQLSYRAIAEQLQVSPKTVENQLGIALRKLRTALADFMVLGLSLVATLTLHI